MSLREGSLLRTKVSKILGGFQIAFRRFDVFCLGMARVKTPKPPGFSVEEVELLLSQFVNFCR